MIQRSSFLVIGIICIFYALFACCVQHSLPSEEFNALYNLFNATNGKKWKWKINVFFYGYEWNFVDPTYDNPCSSNYPWQGIICSSSCGVTACNVKKLQLSSYALNGTIPLSIGNFKMLTNLDLSYNLLQDSIPQTITNLTNLESLSLNNNQFTSTLPENLHTLSKVISFTVYDNLLTGTIPPSIGQMKSLQSVSLGANFLHGSIPSTIGNLTNLLQLDFTTNKLTGSIPPTIGALRALTELYLFDNLLSHTIPESVGQLTNLTGIMFYNNLLTGTLPDTIGRWTQLQYFYSSSNALSGTLPATIRAWTHLIYLDAMETMFTGTVPNATTAWFRVASISIAVNYFTGSLFEGFGGKRITTLTMNDNYLTGSIPVSLGDSILLFEIELYANMFSGSLPSSLGNLVNLNSIDIHENFFTGSIPAFIGNFTLMNFFSFEENYFTGTLLDIFGRLNKAAFLGLSDNFLSGPIPPSIGNMSQLGALQLANNRFTGTLPFKANQLKYLETFNISLNALHGTLSSTFFATASNINLLDVSYNQFSGPIQNIPSSLVATFSSFITNTNLFTGTIPNSICSSFSMRQLDMASNFFSGSIPNPCSNESYASVQYLQLSNNLLTGTFPSGLVRDNLEVLYLNQNAFTGHIPDVWFSSSDRLFSLVLAVNCLSGTIPPSICSARNLIQIVLDGLHSSSQCSDKIFPWLSTSGLLVNNAVGGTLPACLLSLPLLQQLQLSGNNLDGSIHSPDLYASRIFNKFIVANNRFTGTVPSNIWYESSLDFVDVSFNRFRDTIPSNALTWNTSTTTGMLSNHSLSNKTYYFQVNRLSGSIPSSMQSLSTINLLEGNQFGCSLDRHELPSHDPSIESYECGSDTTNAALIMWIVIGGVLICGYMGIVVVGQKPWKFVQRSMSWYRYYQSLKLVGFRIAAYTTMSSNYALTFVQSNSTNYMESNLVDVERCLTTAIRLGIVLFGMGVIILFPFYSTLSVFYSNYIDNYIWILSASYMTGMIPAICMLVLFWMIIAVIMLPMRHLIHVNALFRSASSSFFVLPAPEAFSYANIIYLLKRFILVWIVNAVVVLSVNIGYVDAVVNGNYNVATLNMLSILLSCFKLAWNNILLGGIVYRKVIRNLLQIELTGYHMIILSLFNNIVVPYIAEALISPNCFLYALRLPPSIDVSYLNVYCSRTTYCVKKCVSVLKCSVLDSVVASVFASVTTSYEPPFHYSYQCSSSLMSAFAHVFAYRYILSGIFRPLLILFLKSTAGKRSPNHILIQFLPPVWKLTNDDERLTITPSQLHSFGIIMKDVIVGTKLCVSIVTDLAMMFSFGILFPPLILLILLSMMGQVYFFQISMGRWAMVIRNIQSDTKTSEEQDSNKDGNHNIITVHDDGRSVDAVSKEIRKEERTPDEDENAVHEIELQRNPTDMEGRTTEEMVKELVDLITYFEQNDLKDFKKLFAFGLWNAVVIGAIFWSFALFDTLGDNVGAAKAYWIVLVMVLSPIITLYGWKLVDRMNAREQVERKANRNKQKKKGEEEDEEVELSIRNTMSMATNADITANPMIVSG